MNSAGVISTITALDYLFVPMKADRMILESTLNFATTINDRLITTGQSNIKGLYLFWNMVDRRERNRLFEIYEKGINQLGLHCLLPEQFRTYSTLRFIKRSSRALTAATNVSPSSSMKPSGKPLSTVILIPRIVSGT